jgi:hypothetical protein
LFLLDALAACTVLLLLQAKLVPLILKHIAGHLRCTAKPRHDRSAADATGQAAMSAQQGEQGLISPTGRLSSQETDVSLQQGTQGPMSSNGNLGPQEIAALGSALRDLSQCPNMQWQAAYMGAVTATASRMTVPQLLSTAASVAWMVKSSSQQPPQHCSVVPQEAGTRAEQRGVQSVQGSQSPRKATARPIATAALNALAQRGLGVYTSEDPRSTPGQRPLRPDELAALCSHLAQAGWTPPGAWVAAVQVRWQHLHHT